ncbi:hypothetical protein SAMN04488541_10508 [Thermoflexibacter ruber]|uniref:Uncharacterized protein n=1 Tax=Thermoflexibacter ruber TaxID=1003 RepID=A0A1I2JEG4_9BACT|nr:hypothetical protein SAMN04488541_10508 [Thermoflexibacter ruber]
MRKLIFSNVLTLILIIFVTASCQNQTLSSLEKDMSEQNIKETSIEKQVTTHESFQNLVDLHIKQRDRQKQRLIYYLQR